MTAAEQISDSEAAASTSQLYGLRKQTPECSVSSNR